MTGRRVVFDEPEIRGSPADGPTEQTIVPIDLRAVTVTAARDAEQLRKRLPEDYGRVERNRHVSHNRWLVAGTRIPTAAIWNLTEAGYDAAGILREYPRLRPADIEAALKHERRLRDQTVSSAV